MRKTALLLMLALISGAFKAYAQTDSTATAAVAADEGSLSINGYVDAYYFYNTLQPYNNVSRGRVFDLPHNNFSVGLVQTVLSYTKSKFKVVADLTYGPNADLGNFANYRSPISEDITSTSFAIKQAFGSYNFTDKLALTVGQYGTHIGYEVIDAPLNFNYSLSYLFGNGPFYHTGAKLDFAASSKVGLMLGVVNGWDALQDFNNKKTVTAQIHLTPAENFQVYANWVGGDEYGGNSLLGNDKGSYTSLFDLTTFVQATDGLKIGLNAAYGSYTSGASAVVETDPFTDNATWGGAALYLNYTLSDKFGLGLRAERFEDEKGVRYNGPLKVTAFTLTGDVKLAGGNFIMKPEIRFDSAKDAFFYSKAENQFKKHQTTLGAALIYTFDGNFGK